MATLTTVDGIQITFAPKGVAGHADYDANTGLAVTCVYGVTRETLRISESVEKFMRRLRITKNFAQLTRPLIARFGSVDQQLTQPVHHSRTNT
jgi:hypothetical protein